jgi:hypothetical protein
MSSAEGREEKKSSMKDEQVSERTVGTDVATTATREGYVTLYGVGLKVMEGRILVPGRRILARCRGCADGLVNWSGSGKGT